jgi:RHS repeat-associated protein
MTFYGITGQRLARFRCKYDEIEPGVYRFGVSLIDRTQHIGGQLTTETGKGVTTDRLGSVRARDGERYTYFPYGEPRTATVSESGMYAGLESPVRKYDPGNGRFSTPDPLGLGAVKMGDPGSWNRFAYVQGDPVNYADPRGLYRCSVVTTITGLPAEHTMAEVFCESEGYTQSTSITVRPYDGDADALVKSFEYLGRILDEIEWERTDSTLRLAANAIADFQFSENCWKGIGSITSGRTADNPTRQEIRDMAARVKFHNGVSDPRTANDFRTRPYQALTFRIDPNHHTDEQFWRPSYVLGVSTQQLKADMLHEILHNIGFGDGEIQAAFYGFPFPDDTTNISRWLLDNCVR